VFVGHGQLRLAGQEALNAKHPQPPIHQLFKVALHPRIHQLKNKFQLIQSQNSIKNVKEPKFEKLVDFKKLINFQIHLTFIFNIFLKFIIRKKK
jgi:hypothetical protein